MDANPRRPTLYRLAEDGQSLDLLFGECAQCGGLTFASAHHGCAHCGAAPDRLTTVARPGEGRLLAFVTVHADIVPGITTPQVVGDVEIAPGLTEEALIGAAAEDLTIGMALIARPKLPADPDSGFECWFTPKAAA